MGSPSPQLYYSGGWGCYIGWDNFKWLICIMNYGFDVNKKYNVPMFLWIEKKNVRLSVFPYVLDELATLVLAFIVTTCGLGPIK